jgi:hypothetical protein
LEPKPELHRFDEVNSDQISEAEGLIEGRLQKPFLSVEPQVV